MAIASNWTWEKKYLTSPVTSLEFVGSDLVLSGNGPLLGVYSTAKGVLLIEKCLLQGSRIHGIRGEKTFGNLVLIFGQKVIRVIKLQENPSNSSVRVEAASDIVAFPDLIWDAHWLYQDKVPKLVAIATAHNAVWCWDWKNDVKQLVAQCEEPCILYSACFFGSDLENLIIASGTVFNQVLLWRVQGKKDGNNRTLILQRLTGHSGVIFAINFNKQGTLLSSVSDDRSIRLWKITNLSALESNGSVEPLLVVYGHSARVWNAKLLEMCFVSIGEDLVCNVWSYDGSIVKSYKGHTGRNIWSLAVNQNENLIATGGGDGSVRLWPLSSPDHNSNAILREARLPSIETTANNQMNTRKTKKEDYPRFVSLLDQFNLLIMTNEGCLYKYSWMKNKSSPGDHNVLSLSSNTDDTNHKDQWRLLLKDAEYSSYSVVALSPCHKMVAFGNLRGKIKLQDANFNYPSVELQAYSGKVHSLLWSQQHSPRHLFSCGPDGQITWWNIICTKGETTTINVTPLCIFTLPPSKQRWASAIEIFQISNKETVTNKSALIVCGDRKGSLHLFDASTDDLTAEKCIGPVHSLPLLHGKAGVSHLCLYNNTMYSAGRDGVYRQLRIQNNTLEVIDTKKVYKGLDWVERLLFVDNGDLLIAGFHAAYFVLWSVQHNELLWRVMCGGAHRVWDLVLQQLDSSVCGGVLAFIKDSTIYTHKMTFPCELKKAMLKSGFHGREVTCICHVDSIVGQQGDISDVFVTGSEDTNIQLMISDRSTGMTSLIFTAHGHISSVRALCATKSPRPNIQPKEQINGHPTNDRTCHLLFSGGGRASLKCWRVDLSRINDSRQGDKMTPSPMVFLGEFSFRFSNHRRRRRKHDSQSFSEIRFMSLTSLSAANLKDSCQSLYFVLAACSDGFVRIFSFDERRNRFSLLAQSLYLKRCVLTISHVIDFCTSGSPLVMMFAGDTAGKISCWDITSLLCSHIREHCDSTSVEDTIMTNTMNSEKETLPAGDSLVENKRETVDNNEGEKTVLDGHVSVEKNDTSQPRMAALSSESCVTTDIYVSSRGSWKEGVLEDCVTDCNVSESVTVATKQQTEETNVIVDTGPSAQNQDSVNFGQEVLHEAISNDLISIGSEMPGQISVTDQNGEELNATLVGQSDFSCLPLVPVFLGLPTHVFHAHQSGVNAISLVKNDVSGQYLLVSGGDDAALYAAEFNLKLNKNDVTKVHVTREVSEPFAHTSSVTGVKALKDGFAISSSVDQRIVLWEIVDSGQGSSVFRQRASEIMDVADVQDLEVWGERDGLLVAAVCGVGLQTFDLVGRG